MDNPISALTAQRQRLKQKAAVLQERVAALTAGLTDAVGEQLITGVSDIANLEQHDEYEWTYGRLHFGDGRLSVLYRYSGDDHEADHRGSTRTSGRGGACCSVGFQPALHSRLVKFFRRSRSADDV